MAKSKQGRKPQYKLAPENWATAPFCTPKPRKQPASDRASRQADASPPRDVTEQFAVAPGETRTVQLPRPLDEFALVNASPDPLSVVTIDDGKTFSVSTHVSPRPAVVSVPEPAPSSPRCTVVSSAQVLCSQPIEEKSTLAQLEEQQPYFEQVFCKTLDLGLLRRVANALNGAPVAFLIEQCNRRRWKPKDSPALLVNLAHDARQAWLRSEKTRPAPTVVDTRSPHERGRERANSLYDWMHLCDAEGVERFDCHIDYYEALPWLECVGRERGESPEDIAFAVDSARRYEAKYVQEWH